MKTELQLPIQSPEQGSEIIDRELHHKIGIASATFYPGWEPTVEGHNQDPAKQSPAKLRGDLALESARKATELGYQMVVVDGGSSAAFQEALRATGVTVEEERERGMSAGRRQAFKAVAAIPGVDVIAWVEPEKVSIVEAGLDDPAKAVLAGEADIVVPRRDAEAFATYPDYQAEYEQESNKAWNGILRRHGLLTEDQPDIDAWIGPRIFPNTSEMLELFTRRYRFKGETMRGLKQDSPELWMNALFAPLVGALAAGKTVGVVDVPYRHPAQQTAQEIAMEQSGGFADKRAFQQESLLVPTVHLARLLTGDKASQRASRIERF